MQNTSAIKGFVACIVVILITMTTNLLTIDYVEDTSVVKKSDEIQNVVYTHERHMQRLLDRIASKLEDGDIQSVLNSVKNPDNYSVYAFAGSKLVAWRNALVPVENIKPRHFDRRVINTGNGWYMIENKQVGPIQLFALFRIKQQYHFENQYLAPTFDASLNIDPSNTISLSPSDDGLQITDANGRYLFTIVESNAKELPTAVSLLNICALVVWFIAAIGSVIFANIVIAHSTRFRRRKTFFATLALILFHYFSSVLFTLPPQFSHAFLFSSQVFAYNTLLPSLVCLLEISIWVLVFSICIVKQSWSFRRLRSDHTTRIVLMLLIVLLALAGTNWALAFIVKHSSELLLFVGNIDISPTSLTKLVIISILVFSFMLITEKAYSELCRHSVSVKRYVIILLIMSAVALIPSLLAPNFGIGFVVCFIVLNGTYFAMKRNHPSGLEFSNFVWFAFIVALFVTLQLSRQNTKKEAQNRELLITNLSFQLTRDDDPVAEQLLANIENDIANDTLIFKAFAQKNLSSDIVSDIFTHMRERYFNGYFTKYDIQIVPCTSPKSQIELSQTGQRINCYEYFGNIIRIMGNRIAPLSAFHQIANEDGRPDYLGQFLYFNSEHNAFDHLFIELSMKNITDEVGYPELLTNERDRIDERQFKGYSYALYFDRKLTTHFGEYEYNQTLVNDSAVSIRTVEEGGFSHLVARPSSSQSIVLSYPLMTATQFVADYSIVFLGIFISSIALLMLFGRRNSFVFSNMSIHERIQASFVLFIMLLFIVISIISAKQSVDRYESEMSQRMNRTLTSARRYISHEIGDATSLRSPQFTADIDNLLQRTGTLFDVDVNIFSPEGRLIGSSRRELFMNGIVAPLVNSVAFEEIRRAERREIMLTENIGRMMHYSIYAPLMNSNQQIVGIINVPFFTDVAAVRNRIISTFMPITYAYLLIILISIFFSYFLALGITQPLLRLRESIRKIGLQKRNEKINYTNETDEIGLLVKEYNRMIDELAYSAEQLSVSERESTWREMARQIAHEIKNPLTPMKLNVQYLIRSWDEKRDDFDSFIHRVANTLIEQIDHLAYVAGEFSGMAKTPDGVPERVNVVEKLENCVALFAKSKNATVEVEKRVDEAYAMINADQLMSVFNNLIKNALQSVSEDEQINIKTAIAIEDDRILVTVSDNGHGIATEVREKIFRPNFTTKSTGMGLGLAICKTIITNAHGEIWFETETDRGTTFFISLPQSQS